MRSCQNCLENNWSFDFIDLYVRATCNLCGYEIEFLSKRGKRILEKKEKKSVKIKAIEKKPLYPKSYWLSQN